MNETFVQLLAGNATHAEAFESRFDHLQEGQHPEVVTVCCSDSRVMQDHMWGNEEPGAVFTCGNIGNRVIQRTESGEAISGDVLFPLQYTGTRSAVVVGHTGCGAVKATYDSLVDGIDHSPGIEHCLGILRPHLSEGVDALPPDLDRDDAVNRLVEYNVDRQVDLLRDSGDVPDGVDVVGAVYDFQNAYPGRRGEVHVVNIDGERDVETLRAEHPVVDDRIHRLWEY